jgi:hypothetical protein
VIRVKSLHIYPLKSARGHAVRAFELDRFGPRGDRRWMLVDEAGRFVSQREEPSLARLAVEPLADGLRLGFGGETLAVAHPDGGAAVTVEIWDDRVTARDAGEASARWLAHNLGRPLRLVYMPEDCRRAVDTEYAAAGETVSFADGFPLLLISAAALDGLNDRLSTPVNMDRFRPNIVISGCEPHAEDGWKRLRIGHTELTVAKPCARCAVPSLDQLTGEKHPEILGALASYRRAADRKVYFGQNLLFPAPGGVLRVGDPVEVLE